MNQRSAIYLVINLVINLVIFLVNLTVFLIADAQGDNGSVPLLIAGAGALSVGVVTAAVRSASR